MLGGVPKSGKTTTALSFPKPLIIDLDLGIKESNVAVLRPENFFELITLLDEILNDEHDYKTLVIDKLQQVEDLIRNYLCKTSGAETLSEYKGGWGKGKDALKARIQQVLDRLLSINTQKNMIVVLLTDIKIDTLNEADSNLPSYDRWVGEVYKEVWGDVKGWADFITFIRPALVKQKVEGEDRVLDLKKFLYQNAQTLAYDCGNRFSHLGFPETIERIDGQPEAFFNEIKKIYKGDK